MPDGTAIGKLVGAEVRRVLGSVHVAVPPRPPLIKPPRKKPFFIRFGMGEEKGFLKLGADYEKPAHIIDVNDTWPIADGVVDHIFTIFHFHRLTTEQRWHFMNEAFRVLKKKSDGGPSADPRTGQLGMKMPFWSSMRAIIDPLAQWPPLCESSFMVYNKRMREMEGYAHLPLTCDFWDVYGYGHDVDPAFHGRSEDFLNERKKHMLNVAIDLNVALTKP